MVSMMPVDYRVSIKLDDYTVKFTLIAPLAPFLANLAMDFFAISSPTAIQASGQDYGTPSVGAVGTGPFVFKEWVEGDHITVTANENWWGGRAKVDEVIWRVIPDASARYLALKAGDIHAMEQATSEDLASAQADSSMQVMFKPPLNTVYLAFNYKIVELQDPKVREAIAHAINKPALAEAFWGASGQVAKTLVPASMWGFNDAIEDFAYDPELSKQLLADAGFPDGSERNDHCRGYPGCRRQRGLQSWRQDALALQLYPRGPLLYLRSQAGCRSDGC